MQMHTSKVVQRFKGSSIPVACRSMLKREAVHLAVGYTVNIVLLSTDGFPGFARPAGPLFPIYTTRPSQVCTHCLLEWSHNHGPTHVEPLTLQPAAAPSRHRLQFGTKRRTKSGPENKAMARHGRNRYRQRNAPVGRMSI